MTFKEKSPISPCHLKHSRKTWDFSPLPFFYSLPDNAVACQISFQIT